MDEKEKLVIGVLLANAPGSKGTFTMGYLTTTIEKVCGIESFFHKRTTMFCMKVQVQTKCSFISLTGMRSLRFTWRP